MKIVFFGSPSTALISLKKIIENDHTVELIIAQPDKIAGRGKKLSVSPLKKFAVETNIPIHQPLKIRKDPKALEILKKIMPDLNVVVAYGQIIPASLIYLPKYNSINLHFSLLPKYRGASPVQWALLYGENKTGVTVFELDENMDEGGILTQEEVPILPGESAAELENRLARIGADLLVKTMAQIDKIKSIKQDHSLASYAPRIKKEEGRINWEKDAQTIERQVRAFDPWPSAYTFFEDKRIKILKGSKRNQKSAFSSPGKILSIKKEGIEVGCGNRGIFLIQVLQPENKKGMSAYSYSLGARIKPGNRFG